MQIYNATSDAKIIHFLRKQFRIQVVWGLGANTFRDTLLNAVIRAGSQGMRMRLTCERTGDWSKRWTLNTRTSNHAQIRLMLSILSFCILAVGAGSSYDYGQKMSANTFYCVVLYFSYEFIAKDGLDGCSYEQGKKMETMNRTGEHAWVVSNAGS